MTAERLPHLIVEGFFGTEKYKAASRPGPEYPLPARDRAAHGTTIREQLNRIRDENEHGSALQSEGLKPAPISIEVRSEPKFILNLKSLENRTQGIEIACVRTEGDVQVATIHVPQGALRHFFKLVEEYLTEETDGTEKTPARPRHQDLIDRMTELRLATLHSFWGEDKDVEFPNEDQAIWWEVWMMTRGDQSTWESFQLLAKAQNLTLGTDTIRFPDREVGLVYGTAEQLTGSSELLFMIGEVRRAKENPIGFLELSPRDQPDWVNGLVARVTAPPVTAPAVTLLDAGVVGHTLVKPALHPSDCHRFDPSWPLTDSTTHGTEMAGVILYGRRLAELLAGIDTVTLRHRLESVKILPPPPHRNRPRLYGRITSQAVSSVEISRPERKRVFCMAITTDGRDRGRPSSWSGVIDQLSAGISDGNPRLFILSAGNSDPSQRHLYPNSNDTDNVQDPAQAWNALTVGASTDCVLFDRTKFPGYLPIAPCDDLSPSSTTSLSWDRTWPYKPDIVLEGGNQILLAGKSLTADPEEMAMLTTAHAIGGRLIVDFRDTSAAAAQAARMAAILQAEYPTLWPETIRSLLVHSAEWTDAMKAAFGPKKSDAINRIRRYGYGVPCLDRALHSARSSLTLIAQQTLRPYIKEDGRIRTNDMGIHGLPWPKEQLQALGARSVTMRVTLSYFIEPKPGRRDGFATSRHRYQSHGLRFEVKRPLETLADLRKRVSIAAREEEEAYEPVGDTAGWVLGPKIRTRGSIHSDWWIGTAADLANCGVIAVYPVSGWWREAAGSHWAKEARYALTVSIRTEAVTSRVQLDLFTPSHTQIDLYTPVETAIKEVVKTIIIPEAADDEGFLDEGA
jgi:hypothetical protein